MTRGPIGGLAHADLPALTAGRQFPPLQMMTSGRPLARPAFFMPRGRALDARGRDGAAEAGAGPGPPHNGETIRSTECPS
jgi:hypothetical protein